MANLPEKNITLVDKITSIPSNSNLFLNADGEFRQASVNDVIKSATVVSDTVNNAINDAMQDSIDSHFKQATGSPILLTDTADGTLIDFKGKGRSTQDGTPTPDYPQEIKSVADSGYFDGELLQGVYSPNDSGKHSSSANYVCSKNAIPCKEGDDITLAYHSDTIHNLYILYYDENMNYLSYEYTTTSNVFNGVAPTKASYFNFDVGINTGITPQTAKHIAVTINGKYAFIEKSVGKNLLNCRGLSAKTSEGVTFTPIYDDKGNLLYVNANGTATETALFHFPVSLENGQYTINGCSNGSSSTYGLAVQVRVSNTANTWYASYTGDAQFETSDTKVCTHCFIQVNKGTTVNNVKFYPMIRKAEVTDSTYEPYKETVSYITLNEPLRGVGNVSDVASLNEINRKFTEVVFDGSSDEQWLLSSNCFYINLSDTNIDTSGYCKALCTHFKNHNVWLDIDGSKVDNSFTIYRYKDWVNARLAFYTSKIKTGAEWTEWLQANPIKVIYELAEPVVETIEPIDIVTYDNVTYLTASDNAEMEIEYPTTKVAGIASIGYSKGIKAEYETEQLKKQLLEIQATIVNTL